MAAADIHISVQSFYIDGQSEPDKQQFVFAYTIDIENRGDIAAQLLRRYWLITDANGKESEVSGEGVVGEQPTLGPSETYRYTSGAVIDTPVGTMQGHYEFIDEHGENFIAPIKVFRLAQPGILN